MRRPLDGLSGRHFDVAVVGAGVNGASAAQHLAAEGYDVLLVDKGDFASGSSSRSSRLLHCGLRYLAPGKSLWEFAAHPGRFATACRMAKAAMECRAQFVRTTPERARTMTFCFPFYEDSPYKAWQIDSAFALLGLLGPKDVPLDYRRLSAKEALEQPLLRFLRDPDALRGVAQFREYQFDWPERIVVDTILDAERIGATTRNYTRVTAMTRHGDRWSIELTDALDAAEGPVTVTAEAVFNMAGIWIDEVNRHSGDGKAGRQITGTKGAHIVVQLPPDCADYGIATLNRKREGFYCVPWRGLHYFGPTETLYEGDIDDIRPTEEDVEFLLGEANHLLPSLKLARADVRWSWAGVRPLTYDPKQPMGARSRELHDLGGQGLPNVFAMTAGPIMTHRSAGEEAVRTIKSRIAARRSAQAPSYSAVLPADEGDSPPLLNSDPSVRLAAIRRAAEREQAESLIDVMFRRTGAGWSPTMGREAAERAAQVLGEAKGWPRERVEREARDYLAYLERQHLLSGTV